MIVKTKPVANIANILFFLLNIYMREGIIANSRVAYIEPVRADSTLYVQKHIKIMVV